MCGPGTLEEERVLETLASLLDNSLLVSRAEDSAGLEGDEPRFTMLETIREYAAERLRSSGEAEKMRRAHALYYLALAEAAQPEASSACSRGVDGGTRSGSTKTCGLRYAGRSGSGR